MFIRGLVIFIFAARVIVAQPSTVREGPFEDNLYELGGKFQNYHVLPSENHVPVQIDRIAGSFTVSNTNNSGAGSLSQAILDANSNPGFDSIKFSIGSGAAVIAQPTDLPIITSPVIIDGRSQPGYLGAPLITIDGWGVSTLGLYLAPGSTGSTICGIVVSHFAGNGITVNANNIIIEACYIGTTSDGSQKNSNTGCGIFVQDASYCRIGGTTFFQRNVISGNGQIGVIFRGYSMYDTLQGNYIGTDASGTLAVGNSWEGARCNYYSATGYGASYCLIGGTTPGTRNIISGNDSGGVYLVGASVTYNRVVGNYIGTDVTGTQRLRNGSDGVRVWGSTAGTASNNTIGGPTSAERNIISANGRRGVVIEGGTYVGSFNKIIGNYIGTDVSGTINLGNGQHGVHLTTVSYGGTIADTRIGGASSDSGNVISGNTLSGIYLQGINVTRTSIIGNKIGLSTSSPVPDTIPNLADGIKIEGAERTVVGGATPAAANMIGGNHGSGISALGSFSFPPAICGNFIGTDQSRTTPVGNYLDGICVTAWNLSIGGLTRDSGNVIAFNGYGGISILSGTGNRIKNNAIFSNETHPGIDLGRNGLTVNDSADLDTGPNNLQNFPLLDSIVTSVTNTKVYGRMDSAKSNTTLTIDVYEAHAADTLHFGGADSLVGSTTITTDNYGNKSFSVTIPRVVPPSHVFSATATDPGGNTSEFSQALSGDSDGDGIPDSWETEHWGIDVNSDGVIDYDLWAHGARPNHKDIFVEVDAMENYGPPVGALNAVTNAFASVNKDTVRNPDGTPGIRLHIDQDNYHMQVWGFPLAFTNFKTVKDTAFGTSTERSSPDARFILKAKRLVYRYCIFAKTYGTLAKDVKSSGLAKGFVSEDFMVTFGGPTWGGTRRWQDHAGTFMHELGHTLGLHHGGDDDTLFKTNYISVMNYMWQTVFPQWQKSGSWRLDYSPVPLPDLNESHLNEVMGFNPPAGHRIISVPFYDHFHFFHWGKLAPGTAVDWNGNGDSTNTDIDADLNWGFPPGTPSPDQPMHGFADWSALQYNFRTRPSFGTSPLDVPPELLMELTSDMYDSLNSLPPPRPSGVFRMDGVIDTTAHLLASNAGMNLYGAIVGSQLYVATTSAPTQGGDVFVFVTESRGALHAAPWLKTGQVGTWDAVLANESVDNTAGWYDIDSQIFYCMNVDSAVGFVEGVIDLDLLFGKHVDSVFVAAGRYATDDGGALLVQVPAGNGDGSIDGIEFHKIADTPLPIQLASFAVHAIAGGRIQVEWTTISEINNYGFEVQRKRESESQFIAVPNSFTPGHGTTNEPHHYSFVDSTVTPGNWKYRLKQTDLDGTVSYGPEVVVELLTGVDEKPIPTAFALHQNYPNPFNPVTAIRFDLPVAGHVTLKVFNVLGQEVVTLTNEKLEAGYHSVDFNAGLLSSGVYFYTLKTDGYVSTKKMILTK